MNKLKNNIDTNKQTNALSGRIDVEIFMFEILRVSFLFTFLISSKLFEQHSLLSLVLSSCEEVWLLCFIVINHPRKTNNFYISIRKFVHMCDTQISGFLLVGLKTNFSMPKTFHVVFFLSNFINYLFFLKLLYCVW